MPFAHKSSRNTAGLDTIMRFDIFHPFTVLQYGVYLQLLTGWLTGWWCSPVTGASLTEACVDLTETSKINISCSYRIEVVSIYYDYHQTYSGCTRPSPTNPCHKLYKTGQDLQLIPLYGCSNSKYGCIYEVGSLPEPDCNTNTTFNFVLMEYRCIPDTDFVELCGDADVNITSDVKHLAYFRKNTDDPFQDCTCSIEGRHNLIAVDAGFPSLTVNPCKPVNLWIKRVHKNGSASTTVVSKPKERLIKVDFKGLQSSQIRLIRNCTFYTPPVWFKVKPDKNKTVRIRCGYAIGNPSSSSSSKASSPSTDSTSIATQSKNEPIHSSSSSSLKPTLQSTGSTPKGTQIETSTDSDKNTEVTTLKTTSTIKNTAAATSSKDGQQNTPPLTGKNTKVPAIVGSVIGGIVLIIIIIVIGALVYRRRRREKFSSGEDSVDTRFGHSLSDDDVFAQRHQRYPNNAFEGSTAGYSSVGEIEDTIKNKNGLTPADSLTEYDQLQPANLFSTFPHQHKKTPGTHNDEGPLYDHTKIQAKGSHNASSGSDVKHSDYDVLENKANLNLSFDNVEPLDTDAYDHIHVGNNHDNIAAKSMAKTDNEHVENSAPEYATVNKPREEHEQNISIEGGDNNAIVSSGNTDDANLYHILEEPNAQEKQTEQDGQYSGHAENSAPEYATVNKPREENEQNNSTEGDDNKAIVQKEQDSGRNTDIDNNNPKRFNLTENHAKNNEGFYHILESQD